MRIYLAAFLLLTCAGLAVGNRNRSMATAEPQLAGKEDEATLLRLERAWGQAYFRGQIEVIDHLLAPEWTG